MYRGVPDSKLQRTRQRCCRRSGLQACNVLSADVYQLSDVLCFCGCLYTPCLGGKFAGKPFAHGSALLSFRSFRSSWGLPGANFAFSKGQYRRRHTRFVLEMGHLLLQPGRSFTSCGKANGPWMDTQSCEQMVVGRDWCHDSPRSDRACGSSLDDVIRRRWGTGAL